MEIVHYAIILFFSITLLSQGIFTLFWMLFTWEFPDRIKLHSSPDTYISPRYSFSVLVPVRQEKGVIGRTIRALDAIDYPQDKKEIIIICRFDDEETLGEIRRVLDSLQRNNLMLVVFYDSPINKAHSLNIGLAEATKEVVVVFDAEDEPDKNIFHIVNTVMVRDNADAVQGGVQLMNYTSTWFSRLNVLEYYLWFKSGLHFFASIGLVPLAGNTIWIKKTLLNEINGWDENCLTEDADLGVRLTVAKAKIRIMYDPSHVTREETPPDTLSFIHQRTRWNHGFLHVFLKGDWLKLPRFSQRILALYILTSPQIEAVMLFYIPFALVMILLFKTPVIVSILSAFPMYTLLLQLLVTNISFYEFTKDYNIKSSPGDYINICCMYFFFQCILTVSAIRAGVRIMRQNTIWEKTLHVNAHRDHPVLKLE